MIMDRWTPKQVGDGIEFTAAAKPLEPFRDDLNILTGLAQVQGRALGDGPAIMRAKAPRGSPAYPRRSETNIGCGPSACHRAEYGKATQLASLEISLEAPRPAPAIRTIVAPTRTPVSWKNETVPLPMQKIQPAHHL